VAAERKPLESIADPLSLERAPDASMYPQGATA
jgi:hypothetical protein